MTWQQTREETARAEIGQTTIRRRVAWALCAPFLCVIGAAPLLQIAAWSNPAWLGLDASVAPALEVAIASDVSETDASEDAPSWFARLLRANRAVLEGLERVEDDLDETSVVGRLTRSPAQAALTRLGAGGEQVYSGRPGWLFYRQDVDYITGPSFWPIDGSDPSGRRQPDPHAAILDFEAQLAARGISLIVMPTPVKPTVHPERLRRGRLAGRSTPLQPAAYAPFIEALERSGILVFDPARVLTQAKVDTRTPQFLSSDTHWRPEAVQLVAARLAAFIERSVALPAILPAGYLTAELMVTGDGDTARMLDLPPTQTRYPAELVPLRRIQTSDAAPWRPSPEADVLVLGDSFSNIYSLSAMGWGDSAGFVEQLSYVMQRPIDRIVRNADGAFGTRARLGQQLANGHDRLSDKRLVIFQFASRELAFGDWRLIDLGLGAPRASGFLTVDAGRPIVVRGTIQAITPTPRPQTVPYADHIVAAHLTEIDSDEADLTARQALVYLWGMRDRQWTPAARLRPGARITVRLQAWPDVADRYEGFNRTDLDELLFEEPLWGELIQP